MPRTKTRTRTHPKQHRVQVLVGTRKGAFIFTSDLRRRSWKLDGPHFAGQSVYHFIQDPRGAGRAFFAAVSNGWFGSDVHRSSDAGRTWNPTTGGLRFAPDSGLSMKFVWHLRPGRPSEPGVVYARVDPAALFKSEDGGDTWTEVLSLNRHSTRRAGIPAAAD